MSDNQVNSNESSKLIKSLALSSAGVGAVCCLFELIKKELLKLLESKNITVQPYKDGSYSMAKILDKFKDAKILPKKLVEFFYKYKEFRNDVTHKYSLTFGPIEFSSFEDKFKEFFLLIHFDNTVGPPTEREYLDQQMFIYYEGYESYADRGYSELLDHICRSEVYDLSLYQANHDYDELKKDNLTVNIGNNIYILLLANIVSDSLGKVRGYYQ